MRALLGVLAALAAHPLHTTLTEVEQRDDAVQLTVRAFSDDLRAALTRDVTDSTAARYVRSTVTLADREGRMLPLTWCGLRRLDGVVWLCVRAAAPGGVQGLRLRVGLLFELYADQINIVRTSHDGRRGALLFTRGDPPRPLP
ncbi:MAG TPA: DUF6702 family protein [Gemmatimonadales bacterium]|nr:DUF6702 family protein [Gemmatimonadales bacterium]